MELIIACAGVFMLLVISEVLWRAKVVRDEVARKFVHICVGTFVAFWPYFMSWPQIQLMSLAFLIVILVPFQKHIFHATHSVSRKTKGEIFFPIGIGLAALIAPAPIIFTAAVLHLSLADGFAAIIGKHYGAAHTYKVYKYTKSFAGTASFYLISLVIVTATVALSTTPVTWPILALVLGLPALATLIENLAVAGTDNIFVPLIIIAVLQLAHVS